MVTGTGSRSGSVSVEILRALRLLHISGGAMSQTLYWDKKLDRTRARFQFLKSHAHQRCLSKMNTRGAASNEYASQVAEIWLVPHQHDASSFPRISPVSLSRLKPREDRKRLAPRSCQPAETPRSGRACGKSSSRATSRAVSLARD